MFVSEQVEPHGWRVVVRRIGRTRSELVEQVYLGDHEGAIGAFRHHSGRVAGAVNVLREVSILTPGGHIWKSYCGRGRR